MTNGGRATTRALAMRFVIGIGVVSLFADFTYEGGRSIVGPFLGVLGATPFLVGAIAGVGEFLGYALRLASGSYVDRRGHHWTVVYLGYAINLLAVPAIALTGALAPAAGLVFAERLGKGLRTPARDTLLASASHEIGRGRAFGLHELLDQIGALIGPLAVAGAVALHGYRLGFGILIVPAILAMLFLVRARGLEPSGERHTAHLTTRGFSPTYWRYLAFAALAVMGFAHFALIAFRFAADNVVAPATIPLLFALAMGVDAAAAYLVGRLYDRYGLRVVAALPLLTLPSAPLLFLTHGTLMLAAGAATWGAALGLQESLMRAAVADLTPPERRGTAYGLFDTAFGTAWMLGSLAMGGLYQIAPAYLVAFSILIELASLALLTRVLRGLG
ncbi:MAG TPA: MFS transporter [Trueperaceae bacterium]|nr:MFS transporter [Trueperaceae bacterium]